LTRAAERLVIAGLKPRTKTLAENSWHLKAAAALERLGAEQDGPVLRYRGQQTGAAAKPPRSRTSVPPPALPAWLNQPAPPEARPSRPLAPSQLVEDREAAPPPTPELRAAARRGILLHALFERLPAVAPADRHAAAHRWLEHSAAVAEPNEREPLVAAALGIIDHPEFAALFAPDALAEAPIAATLADGRVVAGTVDRLLVGPDLVQVVDFKTGRSVPLGLDAVPAAHRLQMQAYGEALQVIFPGRKISASLLYTAGPKLIALPD
jgi:ATP-dependent helicase/nuclease subunit A